jgi:KDO2-lipid IV(A) lauroyltransferase
MARSDSATLRDALEYAGLRAGLAVVEWLPEQPSYALARGAMRLAYRVDRGRREAALANLRIAFPERSPEEQQRIARASYAQLADHLVDVLRAHGTSDAELLARFELVGREHFDTARARGRGVIALLPHLGSFELLALVAPALGIPCCVVTRPLSNPRADALLRARRGERGTRVLAHRNVARECLRALARGEALAILNDQYTRRRRGVFTPFFGLRASTSPGPAWLALRSGAAVLPLHLERLARDRHRVVCGPELRLETTGDLRSDVLRVTAQMNAALEALIRAQPEQWIWSHRRFRHSPDLAVEPYREKKRGLRRAARAAGPTSPGSD